jgi:hypothetical protein
MREQRRGSGGLGRFLHNHRIQVAPAGRDLTTMRFLFLHPAARELYQDWDELINGCGARLLRPARHPRPRRDDPARSGCGRARLEAPPEQPAPKA